MNLILASTSPRRKELLQQIGVKFHVVTEAIDETPLEHESAAQYVQRLAQEKARVVFRQNPTYAVLAADTTVALNGIIYSKPATAEEAFAMLSQLSGCEHQVYTAVTLMSAQHCCSIIESTTVRFKSLTPQEIREYIATEEPMDKAGSYGIQGKGAVFVEKISGCYSNVVGLPLAATAELLRSFDIPIWQ